MCAIMPVQRIENKLYYTIQTLKRLQKCEHCKINYNRELHPCYISVLYPTITAYRKILLKYTISPKPLLLVIVVYPTIINQEFYKFFLAKKKQQQIFYRFKPHPEVKLRECIFSYTLFRCKCEVGAP